MPQIVTTSSLISTLMAASVACSAERETVLAFHTEFLGRPAAPDLAKIAGRLLTPGFVAHGGPAGHEADAQGLVSCWRQLGRAVPDFGIEVEDILQAGDRWVVRSVMFGTPVAHVLGLAPTGRSFALQAIHIHRLEDGRIAETWHVEDMAGAARQIEGH